ncbi:actin-5c-related [Anaeramoeba flamelloides]|uniref:Actin-5c-related n=1 Tax=Anaeramoeba flamelloides TaxID=1746091 RepID=A0ABQ8XMM2_9EUKA|nr:actin-5c-related [Anaeramoeba flamelloides]
MESKTSLVLKSGSYTLQFGFSGESQPDITEFTYNKKDDSSNPILKGMVQNWEIMEQKWKSLYEKLSIESSDFPLLSIHPTQIGRKEIEKTIQIFFESFSVPQLAIEDENLLPLYSVGKHSALVVNIGTELTHCVPIVDGYVLDQGIIRKDIGGLHITNNFQNIFSIENYEIAEELKIAIAEIRSQLQSSSTVKQKEETKTEIQKKEKENEESKKIENENGEKENENENETEQEKEQEKEKEKEFNYQTSDKKDWKFTQQQQQSPSEILFNPIQFQKQTKGLHKIIYESIENCPISLRSSLFENIILVGSTMKIKGMKKRIKSEIAVLDPEINLNFIGDNPSNLVWSGGSILASLNIPHFWVDKHEYNEQGPKVFFK